MSPRIVVELADVSKRFPAGPVVLDRLTAEASAGDFISLIGPSGCGKSTLLRLIAGLATPSTGQVLIECEAGADPLASLAFVFQEPTLLPWLTVAANVEAPLRIRGVPPAQRAELRQHALELVKLSDKAGAYPRQLSGGQKMRVSLARALALSPRILLLDEPFGALDELTREHLNEELLAIRQQQAFTAFFVTHSVNEAVFLSNRILVLSANPGRIHTEVIVDLPYPRTAETRQSRPYLDIVAQVSQLLRLIEQPAA